MYIYMYIYITYPVYSDSFVPHYTMYNPRGNLISKTLVTIAQMHTAYELVCMSVYELVCVCMCVYMCIHMHTSLLLDDTALLNFDST